ncbi:MAG TPA: SDR family oxidoreductase [Solirubrobacteraceae bacterium]|nr:SDR family oxidoreductase [Solirubrobacteraceae bacterium]
MARTCSTRGRNSSTLTTGPIESEKLVRGQTQMPWRVYRPAVVVGNSQTGEMDKIDGPHYFFTAIKMLRHHLPGWFPLIGPELGYTNLVPVDFVADAMDHIAHQPGRVALAHLVKSVHW